MVTVWSILFVLAFVGVLGGTAGFVEWFVRSTYFIAFDGRNVAIYEGRPGGFLWFQPHVVEVTSLTRDKVFSPYVPLVEKGMIETSYGKARKVASKLGDANAFLSLPAVAAAAVPATSATTLSGTAGSVSTAATTAVASGASRGTG